MLPEKMRSHSVYSVIVSIERVFILKDTVVLTFKGLIMLIFMHLTCTVKFKSTSQVHI